MIAFSGRGILLDIEGTTSSVSFVYDVMFPFVRRELDAALVRLWSQSEFAAACQQIARDAGHETVAAWAESSRHTPCAEAHGTRSVPATLVRAEVLRLMDGDVKATGLKQLQGILWQAGFESGELKAHIYDDVPPALAAWKRAGLDVRIYSSGSVQAQRLFFGHTIAGDLLGHFRGHYDTTTGGKKEAASYRQIAQAFGLPGAEILFLSDVTAELDAARAAEFQTALCLRSGNAPVAAGHGHPEIGGFGDVVLRERENDQ